MQSKSNFLKRPSLRSKSHHQLNINKISTRTLTRINTEQSIFTLKQQNIKDFAIIGLFDKKVIVSYNNKLKLFGYFDLHAVHERIRYEYYCWKIKSEQWVTTEINRIDETCIEKGEKMPHSAFGRQKKCLIRIEKSKEMLQMGFKMDKLTSWGVSFEKNSSNQVYVTSFRLIFGKELSQLQIISLAEQLPNIRKGGLPRVINDWIGEFSCKSAFKFNDELTMDAAKLLIGNLGHCKLPWHCVHGRTTIHIKPWPRLNS